MHQCGTWFVWSCDFWYVNAYFNKFAWQEPSVRQGDIEETQNTIGVGIGN